MAGHNKEQRRRANMFTPGERQSRTRRARLDCFTLRPSYFRATPTDRRWKREQAYDHPFRHPRD